MCGIYGLLFLSDDQKIKKLREMLFNRIRGRGPEDTEELFKVFQKFTVFMGFHRLKINDTSDKGNQPFVRKIQHSGKPEEEIWLVCNGEIYNHEKLESQHDFKMESHSDCESLIQLYMRYGIEEMSRQADGVFSCLVYHFKQHSIDVFATRDPFGVRPMFYGKTKDDTWGFSSELKGLAGMIENVKQFPPGHYGHFHLAENAKYWTNEIKQWYYHHYIPHPIGYKTEKQILDDIHNKMYKSVAKRFMSDRPVCALLSGGVDSSIVASILSNIIHLRNPSAEFHTFCIGMEGASDFKYAKMVADHIGSIHHEVVVTKEDFLNALPEVVRTIESYDLTTVRASTGQYLISKYISENTDFKVVYIGDGSDELVGGYKYFCNAPSDKEFMDECERLISEIHMYDVLRADRAVSCFGLETRVPFLDKEFVKYYLEINPGYRRPRNGIEKYLLRKAFDRKDFKGKLYLPKEVLWRQKEAFSDGVSKKKTKDSDESWYVLVQNFVKSQVTEEEFEKNRLKYRHLTPYTLEGYYFRKIFAETYGDEYARVIPYFWLPKWSGDVLEPSARVLKVYTNDEDDITTPKLSPQEIDVYNRTKVKSGDVFLDL